MHGAWGYAYTGPGCLYGLTLIEIDRLLAAEQLRQNVERGAGPAELRAAERFAAQHGLSLYEEAA